VNLFWDVYSTNYTTISAQYNWWGASPPDPLVTENIDYSGYLESNPLSKRAMQAPLEKRDEVVVEIDTTGAAELNAARQLYGSSL
jgi:hypothetical protein